MVHDIAKDSTVTLPSGGIYLSKFMAGIMSAVIIAALLGGYGNLWYLNRKAIETELHIRQVNSLDATLPGALSRREWAYERQLIATQLSAINGKLDDLKEAQRQLREAGS